MVAYHRTQRSRNERAGRSSNLSLPLMQMLGNRPLGLNFAGGAAEWLEFVGILRGEEQKRAVSVVRGFCCLLLFLVITFVTSLFYDENFFCFYQRRE